MAKYIKVDDLFSFIGYYLNKDDMETVKEYVYRNARDVSTWYEINARYSKCGNCGFISEWDSNYCPKCGSLMTRKLPE